METSKKPSRTIEVLLLICVVVLVITNLRLNSRISNLENAVNNAANMQVNNMFDIRHHFSYLSGRMNTIGEELTQSARASFGEIALVQRYDASTTSADIQVSFYLREHNLGDTVGVTAKGRDGDTHSAVASFENGRFTADMSLPLRGNYMLTFTAQGEAFSTGELMQFSLAEMLCRRFYFWLGQGQSWGTNQPAVTTLTPSFTNNMQGDERLGVSGLSLVIEGEERVIKTWDLMPYLDNIGGMQVLNVAEGLQMITGDEPGNVRPGERIVARLVIYDNLGIRYEQRDQIFIPDRGSSTPPRSVTVGAERAFWAYDGFGEWGFIRIVE